MHILVYQNDRSRNASSDRKMNHIILLVNVQTFQKYNYYYFLFIGCNHKMWFQGDALQWLVMAGNGCQWLSMAGNG